MCSVCYSNSLSSLTCLKLILILGFNGKLSLPLAAGVHSLARWHVSIANNRCQCLIQKESTLAWVGIADLRRRLLGEGQKC